MASPLLSTLLDPLTLRLLLALVLGALVGLEREVSRHPAGLRTHILVCMGSTVFTLLSLHSLLSPTGAEDLLIAIPEGVDLRVVRDPARIAAQVVTGIGFIGGGVVLRHGATIRGLTTAASLWMVASIGMLVGSGYVSLAVTSTLLTLIVLLGFRKVGRFINRKNQKPYNRLKLNITLQSAAILPVQTWVDDHFRGHVLEVKTRHLDSSDNLSQDIHQPGDLLQMAYVIDMVNRDVLVNQLIKNLDTIDGVRETYCRLYFSAIGSALNDHDD